MSALREWFLSATDYFELNKASFEFIGSFISIGGSIFTIFTLVYRLWRKYSFPKRVFNKFLSVLYSKADRKSISRYYIPTRAQDIDPCEHEEIRNNNGKYISTLLIPFFLEEAFGPNSQGKYYLVLGDSGMGKTTFLLRLYKKSFVLIRFLVKQPTSLILMSAALINIFRFYFVHLEAVRIHQVDLRTLL